jgi:hypothetical protein
LRLAATPVQLQRLPTVLTSLGLATERRARHRDAARIGEGIAAAHGERRTYGDPE